MNEIIKQLKAAVNCDLIIRWFFDHTKKQLTFQIKNKITYQQKVNLIKHIKKEIEKEHNVFFQGFSFDKDHITIKYD